MNIVRNIIDNFLDLFWGDMTGECFDWFYEIRPLADM